MSYFSEEGFEVVGKEFREYIHIVKDVKNNREKPKRVKGVVFIRSCPFRILEYDPKITKIYLNMIKLKISFQYKRKFDLTNGNKIFVLEYKPLEMTREWQKQIAGHTDKLFKLDYGLGTLFRESFTLKDGKVFIVDFNGSINYNTSTESEQNEHMLNFPLDPDNLSIEEDIMKISIV